MAEPYALVDELRQALRSDTADDDSALERAIDSASRRVDAYCGRRFWMDESATTRHYRTTDPCRAWVDDFHTTTGLVITTGPTGSTTTWSATDYELAPLNGVCSGIEGFPYFEIVGVARRFDLVTRESSLHVTAKWGWADVPPPVKEATIKLAAQLHAMREAPLGVAGIGATGFDLQVRDMPMVARLLDPYSRRIPGIA